MSGSQKIPRVRSTAFGPGVSRTRIVLEFASEEIAELGPYVEATGEIWVDDALKQIILSALTQSPRRVEHASHLVLLRDFAAMTDSIFKQKLKEAQFEAAHAIADHLTERGITE